MKCWSVPIDKDGVKSSKMLHEHDQQAYLFL
jgi:hypothetical protein